MLRLPDGSLAKLVLKEHLKKAKGNRGRPKQTRIRQIYNDLKPINKTYNELTEGNYERERERERERDGKEQW